jgi:hypothetical protein
MLKKRNRSPAGFRHCLVPLSCPLSHVGYMYFRNACHSITHLDQERYGNSPLEKCTSSYKHHFSLWMFIVLWSVSKRKSHQIRLGPSKLLTIENRTIFFVSLRKPLWRGPSLPLLHDVKQVTKREANGGLLDWTQKPGGTETRDQRRLV